MRQAILTLILSYSFMVVQGQSVFEKTFGSPYEDGGYSVLQTPDSGFVFTGYWGINGGDPAMCLIKTDANGNLLWNKFFPGGKQTCFIELKVIL